jgi:hypothetical protein
MDTQVVEQFKNQVKPAAKKAGKTTDEVFGRVIGLARGLRYEPHPRRKKLIALLTAAIPSLGFGVLIGRHRAQH